MLDIHQRGSIRLSLKVPECLFNAVGFEYFYHCTFMRRTICIQGLGSTYKSHTFFSRMTGGLLSTACNFITLEGPDNQSVTNTFGIQMDYNNSIYAIFLRTHSFHLRIVQVAHRNIFLR
jgi:hypothetical protein